MARSSQPELSTRELAALLELAGTLVETEMDRAAEAGEAVRPARELAVRTAIQMLQPFGVLRVELEGWLKRHKS